MTHLLRHGIIALVLLVIGVADVAATTTLARGIVLDVKTVTDRKGHEHEVIVVRLTWSNYHGEDATCKIEVDPDAVILLDGKLVEREQAMKPGHLVKALLDCHYFEFYSKTGQRALDTPPDDPADAVYTLNLPGAVPLDAVFAKVQVDLGRGAASLALHLDCRADGIRGAAAALRSPGATVKGYGGSGVEYLSRGAYQNVDASQLQVADGKLSGEITVSYHVGLRESYKRSKPPPLTAGTIATVRYTIDATVGSDGAVTGTWSGTHGDTPIDGKLAGTACARPTAPTDYTAWMRLQPEPGQPGFGHRICFAAFKWRDGTLVPDFLGGVKASPSGAIESGTATLEDGQLSAEVQLRRGQLACTMKLTGIVIGDLLFGTYTLTDATGATCTGRLRGEVLTVDAPAVAGWSETKHRKVVARLKAQRALKGD